jgi:UPF0716 protein FxsA
MVAVLGLLFLVVPIAELYVIVQVASEIGVGSTLLLLIVISVLGAWLSKREGVGVMRRLQRTVAEGRVPSAEIVDGALILFAGALMLTPGFLSDCLALVLLFPPTRGGIRRLIVRRIRAGNGIVTVISGTRRPGSASNTDVWDADSWEDSDPGDPPELR